MTNEYLPLPLGDDELLLGHAYAILLPLLDRLAVRPFDPSLHAELRLYLDRLSDVTAEAFDRMTGRGPHDLGASASLIDAVLLVEGMLSGE